MTLTQLQREGLASAAGGNLVIVSRRGRVVYAIDQESGQSYTRQANGLVDKDYAVITDETTFDITPAGRAALEENQ